MTVLGSGGLQASCSREASAARKGYSGPHSPRQRPGIAPGLLRLCYTYSMAYKHYTDDEKAVALAYLKAAGYPDRPGSLTDASRHTGMSTRQLQRLYKGDSVKPSDILVAKKEFELETALTEELAAIFDAMGGIRDEASYKDLATAAGIFIDKRQLLTNSPTQNINHMINNLTDDERRARMKELAQAITEELRGQD